MNRFRREAVDIFGVEKAGNPQMEQAQKMWSDIVQGNPYWQQGDVESINFAKFITQYVSKKACLDLKVRVEGSERADYINKCVNEMVGSVFRDKIEDMLALGGIIIKPSGSYMPNDSITYIMPSNYIITDADNNGNIRGIIFIDSQKYGKYYYTRLEYHHFVGGLYVIENRGYRSEGDRSLGDRIDLASYEPWKNIPDELTIDNVEKPLFAYLKTGNNNTIDYNSPEGVSVFENIIKELKDLDIAWSRKASEVEDSQHITFIDEAAMVKQGKEGRYKIELPRFVRGLRHGVNETNTVDEHVATLLTEQRIADINSILSMISTKAGFSQGQFVMDRKTGQITATQIESDDSETIETITDIRNRIKVAIKDLIYALDKYCDIIFDMPSGYVNALDEDVAEEDVFYFKDLLSTFEQDRTRAYQLLLQGIYSKKKYLMEYEGFSEKEAVEMLAEAKSENTSVGGLFSAE